MRAQGGAARMVHRCHYSTTSLHPPLFTLATLTWHETFLCGPFLLEAQKAQSTPTTLLRWPALAIFVLQRCCGTILSSV
ncbi:hypothetical protein BOTBODRAFT_495953 [Botryobasidium botryosum FD-172 SS1]|uniref:Uncharacterized protein n=1 Tax=Botryobasidium botryosum (strain FD-172 SS1) TaxID=930990 RepID=A0A067M3R9_BOTB1|nr:hypothetical protein BOTBODRAFT_495953 [Botryobasidium botryosum FD-172 SS1]